MKNVMITGASGYIGSNLHDYLAQGYNLTCVDKRAGSNILSLNLSEATPPDCIVHLAAMPSIGDCEENPEQSFRDNVVATTLISEFARNNGIPVIFASSQAAKDPLSSNYAMHKYVGENLLLNQNRCFSLRFANVYGGKNFIDDKTSVIAKFLRKHRQNEQLVVNGDGSQTRDFIHVEDVCEAIARSISKLEESNQNQILDVGTGKETTILSIAQAFGSKYACNYKSGLVGIESNRAETEKMAQVLGFRAQKEVFDYVREKTDE